ncbi:hypothetical protein HPP92_027668 [Vanilla planifolia]|uniref:Uncharacterized protein n=1 Tax=Vanilla planifolia TaxID=51239 RepID=A0A835PE67_VANPL|nr:hypothetical protein HPP92_027668 [Vanilla planifolia]
MAVKLLLRRSDRTNPVIWALAIVCTGLVVAVILTGIAVFVIYLVYQPKAPSSESPPPTSTAWSTTKQGSLPSS